MTEWTMTEFKILTLHNAYNFKLLKLCHKMIYTKENIPYFLQNIYKPKTTRNLRNRDDFATPYYRTNVGQRSIKYSVTQSWNKLPSHLKFEKNERIFSRKVKSYLLDSQLTSWGSCLFHTVVLFMLFFSIMFFYVYPFFFHEPVHYSIFMI